MEECLSSIYAQDFQDFEVILVDNASKDGSVEFLRTNFPEVRLVKASSNLGFSGGNNLGLSYCSGEHIFFLNNDTHMESGALKELARSIEKYSTYRVFACFLLKFSNPELVDSAGDTIYKGGFITSFARYPASLFTSPREVTAACAGAAVYSKNLLDDLGGFDEDFFLVFEDVDLSLRARHHGESILFLPEVKIRHKGSATFGGHLSPAAFYYGTRNYLLFILKNFPLFTLYKSLPGIIIMLGIRFLQGIRLRQTKIFLRASIDCMRMIPEISEKRKKILSQSNTAAITTNQAKYMILITILR